MEIRNEYAEAEDTTLRVTDLAPGTVFKFECSEAICQRTWMGYTTFDGDHTEESRSSMLTDPVHIIRGYFVRTSR